MPSDVDKLLKKNQKLNQLDGVKVTSHVQRDDDGDGWVVNILMLEGYDVPFKYRRKKLYKSLEGAPVNLTYYPCLLYTSPSPRDATLSRMPSSA